MKLVQKIASGVLLSYVSLLSPAFAERAAPRPAPPVAPSKPVVAPTPKKAKSEAPKIEVVFVLDTTGSMGGLIEGAKQKIWSISNEMMKGTPTPELKIGLVAYRDKGDEYVTRTTELTTDLDKIYTVLMGFEASGGGDGPEHVNQGLKDAIDTMSWSSDKKAIKMIFLVGDAPPHEDYGDNFDHKSLAKRAIEKGIVVNTIRCGGDYSTETYWKTIALAADGSYLSLEQSGGMAAVTTPYDDKLAELGAKLDSTAVSYGDAKKREEAERDRVTAAKAAEDAAPEVAAARASAKGYSTGSAAYSYDVISELEAGRLKIEDVKAEQLPVELQKLSPAERKTYLEKKLAERKEIRAQILAADKDRSKYIAEEEEKVRAAAPPSAAPAPSSFDGAVRESIRKEAKKKGTIAY